MEQKVSKIPSNFHLYPNPPYNFAWSAMFFGHFKNDVVDVWILPTFNSNGSYYRVFEVGKNLCLVRVTQEGEVNKPRLSTQVLKGNADRQLYNIIARIFRVNDDINGFYHIAGEDPVMSRLIKRFYGLKPTQTPTVFEMIIIAISEQQLSLPVAVTLRSRLAQRFGKSIEYQGKTFYSFPSAEILANADVDDLCSLSFPRRKAGSIINVARIVANEQVDFESLHSMSNEDIKEYLIKIPGLGSWSAEYILARGLGRLDIYPRNDLSVKRAVGYFYNNGNTLSSSEVEKILSRWHPFQRYAEYYILVAYEMRNYQATINIESF